MADDTKLCTNCKRDIASANFLMHEVHCRRHITLCKDCNEPVPRSEMEQHFNEVHAKVPCELCQLEVAKEDMEKHKESECSKKMMHCEFCELTVPKSELESHLDYCGSRTECCPLCQQYIMLKDMLRHENSGCSYPEPKPVPVPRVRDPNDPFNMAELQQMLNVANFGASVFGESTLSNLHPGLLRNGAAAVGGPVSSSAAERIVNSRATAASKSNVGRSKKNPNGKKSDVNVERARNLLSFTGEDDQDAIPPDMDYDTLLALQLAHEDWQQDGSDVDGFEERPLESINDDLGLNDFGGFVDDSLEPWNVLPSSSVSTENMQGTGEVPPGEDNDLSGIPCEVCNVVIPTTDYTDHLNFCDGSPVDDTELRLSDLNNELDPPQRNPNRATIPVIDNLGSPGTQPRLDDLSQNYTGPDGDILLPCEFCEEMFPSEIIIQHQSGCHLNGTLTPRVTTPATGSRNLASKPPTKTNLSFKAPIPSRPRRQPDPNTLLDFVTADGGDTDEYRNRDMNHFRFHKVPESSSNKYTPALPRFDDNVMRPPRRGSRPHAHDNGEGEERMSEASGSSADRRQNKSAQRTRATLDQLLQVNSRNAGAVGTSTSSSSSDTSGRQAARATGSSSPNKNRPDLREKRTHVNSRVVKQQLDQANQRTGASRSGTSNNNSSSSSSTSTSSRNRQPPDAGAQGSNTRSSQRTGQLFSPELRLKPDHNPPPKKR